MNKILHVVTMSTLALGAAALVGGCKITAETGTIYNGTPVSKTLTYTDGFDIIVEGDNGEIELKRGNDNTVTVTFEPFTFRPDNEAEEAAAEMEQKLAFTASDEGRIFIKAKKNGETSGLGAHIVVTLPAGFNGAVDVWSGNGGIDASLSGGAPSATTVHTDNGSLDISGAQGVLAITQGNGVDCDVSVIGWSVSDGKIACDSIDANVTIASGLIGNITVVADGGVISDPTPLPTDWIASEANVENSKAFSFGGPDAADMGIVAITNEGDVFLYVNN